MKDLNTFEKVLSHNRNNHLTSHLSVLALSNFKKFYITVLVIPPASTSHHEPAMIYNSGEEEGK